MSSIKSKFRKKEKWTGPFLFCHYTLYIDILSYYQFLSKWLSAFFLDFFLPVPTFTHSNLITQKEGCIAVVYYI